MKRIFAALFIALGALAASAQNDVEELRVLSYNTHNAIGMDDSLSYERIGQTIAAIDADLVALQELDSATVRSSGRVAIEEIARFADMYPIFASAIDWEGGRYGIGMLTRQKPLNTYKIALPGADEARTMLVAEFEEFVFACTHLSLNEADRMASVPLILDEVKKTQKPFIIAGDFNSAPTSPVMEALSEKFIIVTDVNEPTFPADKPFDTIDYIAIANSDFEVDATEVKTGNTASDHLPVVADIRLVRW